MEHHLCVCVHGGKSAFLRKPLLEKRFGKVGRSGDVRRRAPKTKQKAPKVDPINFLQ